MHIDGVPNRTSRPTYLLRESYREGKKVRKRTLANLSTLSDEQIEAIRAVLSGQTVRPVEELWQTTQSRSHGAVQAVRVAMQGLGFEALIASRSSPEVRISRKEGHRFTARRSMVSRHVGPVLMK